jgi:hypothetical protein
MSVWTELILRLAGDGRLWVERVEWEDNRLASSGTTGRRWFVSSDGATWAPSEDAPDDPGRQLGRVET